MTQIDNFVNECLRRHRELCLQQINKLNIYQCKLQINTKMSTETTTPAPNDAESVSTSNKIETSVDVNIIPNDQIKDLTFRENVATTFTYDGNAYMATGGVSSPVLLNARFYNDDICDNSIILSLAQLDDNNKSARQLITLIFEKIGNGTYFDASNSDTKTRININGNAYYYTPTLSSNLNGFPVICGEKKLFIINDNRQVVAPEKFVTNTNQQNITFYKYDYNSQFIIINGDKYKQTYATVPSSGYIVKTEAGAQVYALTERNKFINLTKYSD